METVREEMGGKQVSFEAILEQRANYVQEEHKLREANNFSSEGQRSKVKVKCH